MSSTETPAGSVGPHYPPALDDEPMDSAFDVAAAHVHRYIAAEGKGEDMSPDGAPVLLLTTLGRRSGKPRRNPTCYGRRGDDYILVASKGGSPDHPLWFTNLVAEPHVKVQVMDKRFRAVARVADGEEYDELFALMRTVLPALNDYITRTDRQIPVAVLTPEA